MDVQLYKEISMLTSSRVMEVQAEYCRPETLECRCIRQARTILRDYKYGIERSTYIFNDGSQFIIERDGKDGSWLWYKAN